MRMARGGNNWKRAFNISLPRALWGRNKYIRHDLAEFTRAAADIPAHTN